MHDMSPLMQHAGPSLLCFSSAFLQSPSGTYKLITMATVEAAMTDISEKLLLVLPGGFHSVDPP